ncbi:MAG: ATP-binding protein [Acidobacteriaceae bacterium]
MKVFHSLYAKIFGWFWLTLIVGGLLVLVVALFSGSRPLGHRWMRMTQDMYAHTAVDFYESGGDASLEKYLSTLQHSSGIEAGLLDEHQRDVLGRPLPIHTERVMQESLSTGDSTFRLGRIWTAATPVPYGSRRFLFVMEVRPTRGFIDGTFALPALSRLALALVVAALFCLLLTRHIVAPVRALQIGAQQLAAGDLSTRVLPRIAPRNDELADTAKAFDQMADRMQLLIQRRQELLADISHELRSPLTRISVSLELILRGELDVAAQMQADVERMNEMIGQILLLTRLDIQPSSMSEEPVSVPALLEGIAHDAEFEAQREGKSVEVRMEQPCSIRGDANLLGSCIENVVRNAVHYTAPHTAVEILSRHVNLSGKPFCEIVVTDHGPGVPESAVPHLFDPFFRVSEARAPDEGGTGLGLSISKRIAEFHGGSIHAENLVNRSGLQVTLRLPAC